MQPKSEPSGLQPATKRAHKVRNIVKTADNRWLDSKNDNRCSFIRTLSKCKITEHWQAMLWRRIDNYDDSIHMSHLSHEIRSNMPIVPAISRDNWLKFKECRWRLAWVWNWTQMSQLLVCEDLCHVGLWFFYRHSRWLWEREDDKDSSIQGKYDQCEVAWGCHQLLQDLNTKKG